MRPALYWEFNRSILATGWCILSWYYSQHQNQRAFCCELRQWWFRNTLSRNRNLASIKWCQFSTIPLSICAKQIPLESHSWCLMPFIRSPFSFIMSKGSHNMCYLTQVKSRELILRSVLRQFPSFMFLQMLTSPQAIEFIGSRCSMMVNPA